MSSPPRRFLPIGRNTGIRKMTKNTRGEHCAPVIMPVKVREINQLLSQQRWWCTASIFRKLKDRTTFVENAASKRATQPYNGLPAIADGSGIEVDFSQQRHPRQAIRPVSPEGRDDRENNRETAGSAGRGSPSNTRTARFSA